MFLFSLSIPRPADDSNAPLTLGANRHQTPSMEKEMRKLIVSSKQAPVGLEELQSQKNELCLNV
jgi:hypothetical protein